MLPAVVMTLQYMEFCNEYIAFCNLHMTEHRLVRQVLLHCVKHTHETLFADVPNPSIDNATKMSKDTEAVE